VRTSIWSQEFKTHDQLGMEEIHEIHWENCIRGLKMAHIDLLDEEDELVWVHDSRGVYNPKLVYIQLNIDLHLRESDCGGKTCGN